MWHQHDFIYLKWTHLPESFFLRAWNMNFLKLGVNHDSTWNILSVSDLIWPDFDLKNDFFWNLNENCFPNLPFSLSLLILKWYFIIKSKVKGPVYQKFMKLKFGKKSKILYKLNKSQWTWKMHYWVTQSVQLRASDSIPILHLQLSLTFEVNCGHSRSLKVKVKLTCHEKVWWHLVGGNGAVYVHCFYWFSNWFWLIDFVRHTRWPYFWSTQVFNPF